MQESDEHPNVIRWICTEQLDAFLYIALELCDCSLADVIERPVESAEVATAFDAKDAMRQIAAGVAHLHRLKLVHRDIKPQNVLVTRSRTHGRPLRMLISDFGLCKRLDQDASSFAVTNTSPAVGSAGWRAPEALRGEVDTAPRGSSTSSDGPLEASAGVAASRLTRAIDIFSLGALFFYVLTAGDHPFGGRFEREANVLADSFNLDRLAELGDEAYEAQMLVTAMIAHEPRSRCVGGCCARADFRQADGGRGDPPSLLLVVGAAPAVPRRRVGSLRDLRPRSARAVARRSRTRRADHRRRQLVQAAQYGAAR